MRRFEESRGALIPPPDSPGTGRTRARQAVATFALTALLCGGHPTVADATLPSPGEIRDEERRLHDRALELLLERERRVLPISERLRVASAAICPDDLRPVLGLVSASEWELMLLGLRPAASEAARDVEILQVAPGYPSAEAGLRPGDVIHEMGGRPVRSSADLYRRPRFLDDLRSLELTIERAGSRMSVRVPYVAGCFFPARVWTRGPVNAYAHPEGILITTGLLRFAASDDELAAVLGHEMGHGITKAWDGVDSESEADYVGLYLAARAGFDIDVAQGFWRRFAIRSPLSMSFGKTRHRSHPDSSRRVQDLEATVREIRQKQSAGLPLLPEVRD